MISKTIGEILDETAEDYPDNDALVYVDRDLRYTYKEFKEKCEQIAKGLMALGIKHGDHIAVWAYNVPEWVLLQFASAKIGAILVTVNTYYKSHELEYLLKQSDSTTLFLVGGFKDVDYVKILNTIVPNLSKSRPGKLSYKKLPYLKNIVFIGDEKQSGMYNFEDIIKLGEKYLMKNLKNGRTLLIHRTLSTCSIHLVLLVFLKE